MKTDLEELSPTRVRLTVEVPFDELKPNLDAAYKKVARQVRIPGFRPGKVPPQIIDQRLGRPTVVQEAVNDAVPTLYGKAVEESEIVVLGQPELELTKLEDGDELAFTAEVDIRPSFDVPDYDKLPVRVDDSEVTPDDVEEELGTLRERFATLKGVDRPVETGDFVSIDLSATVGGEPLEEASASGMSYEVGDGSLIDGLDDALVGMSAGEPNSFVTNLVGGEHAGEEAEVTVTVHSVKVKDMPELDDEFAELASEFDTLGELRADVRGGLEQRKRFQQLQQARERGLESFVDKVDIPLPDGVVEGEIERRKQSIDQQLEGAGVTREQYLQIQGTTVEDFEADLQRGARQAVKAGFVFDKLAQQEQFGVSQEDLANEIMAQASRIGVAPNQLAQHLSESGQVAALMSDIVRAKAMDLVVEHVEATDESGNTVDLDAIRQEQAEQAGGQTVRAANDEDDEDDEVVDDEDDDLLDEEDNEDDDEESRA